ncbi:MAG TPA: hypothetical protein VFV99_16145 [Kofleriaceae bacterium]|nr:hypothetical protein [Kofleriaceae bacterium]
MNEVTRSQLLKELAARGYRDDGSSPNRTIVIDYDELSDVELGELLEQTVARREKIFRAVDTLGKDAAMQSYDDAQRAIDAMKVVIRKLTD